MEEKISLKFLNKELVENSINLSKIQELKEDRIKEVNSLGGITEEGSIPTEEEVKISQNSRDDTFVSQDDISRDQESSPEK